MRKSSIEFEFKGFGRCGYDHNHFLPICPETPAGNCDPKFNNYGHVLQALAPVCYANMTYFYPCDTTVAPESGPGFFFLNCRF